MLLMSASPDAVLTMDARYTFTHDPSFPVLPEGLVLGETPGVGIDADDQVIIVNRAAVPIQVYSTSGEFIAAWPYDDFTRVHSLTIVPDGHMFVSDDLRHVVREFDAGGNHVRTFGTPGVPADTGRDIPPLGVVKHEGPPFNQPTDAAIGLDGTLYMTDGYGNARVHRFSRDGELLQSWGRPGSGPGEFNLPHGVRVDNEGRVLVADRENNRIQAFSPDGEYLFSYDDLYRPCGILVDESGAIFVAELGESHGRISILDADGTLLSRWMIEGDVPKAGAHSVALDSEGNLYVGLVYFGEPPPPGSHPLLKFLRG